jgi:shikimate dehydrogenase
MTDHYAVVGNPVAHSVSPQIHAEFARQTGQDLDYVRLLAPLDGFAACIADFRSRGGKGVNVTLPFKHEAWKLAAAHAGYALDAGAVNTIDFRNGKITGYNTDGVGLVQDIRGNLQCAIKGKRVLLLGAGGATYGVIEPLMREHPEQLVVANRTIRKAIALVGHFEKLQSFSARGISARPYPELQNFKFDIVINATSAGLNDEMPSVPSGIFDPGALAYDMVYGKRTPFMKFAAGCGTKISDGMGMLVEQAAESFFIWRGVRPQTAPVIALLKGVNSES